MDPRQHCLQAGESLPLVAERYDLPGWQSLYFSGCNLTFRQQHPDPWNLPEGAVLSIPELGDEQRQVLTWRMGMLERIEKDVSAAAREQIDSLQGLKLELAGGAEGQRPMLGRVLATVVRSTVNAMHMVKFFEAGMSTQNGFLALDAAARWDLSDLGQAAGLANLLGRAADGIVWGIEPATAQTWCDANSPQFWGVPLLRALNRGGVGVDAMQLINTLQGNCRLASTNVSRELRGMRSAAIAELNAWSRLVEARGPAPATLDESEGGCESCACPD